MKQKQHPIEYKLNTTDHWPISLFHYPSETRSTNYPVLLVHGLASNRYNFDFPVDEINMAKFLHQAGFDVWIIDLRGSGKSKKSFGSKSKPITFEDYALKDIPTAVKKIKEVSGKKKFHWVGHSFGGVIAYGYIEQVNPKDLKSLITIATPVTTKRKVGYIQYTFEIDRFLRYLPCMPYKLLAPLAKLFSKHALEQANKYVLSKDNMTLALFKQLLHHTVENVPSSLLLQIHDWFRDGSFGPQDKSVDYSKANKKFTMPTLMMIGANDDFTHLEDVQKVFKQIPTKEKKILIFGKKHGHKVDYNHIDMILGIHAKKEVYPQILAWLKKYDK